MSNIAILGLGVVGNGVFEVIEENNRHIQKAIDRTINIKYVLDKRAFPDHPLADRITSDFSVILNDPSISVVVETMGGTSPAFEFSKAALMAGKSVVTSNKEVVDRHGRELIEIAHENHVSYMYEASVGGGIPIINTLKSSFLSNKIIRIAGILNGTTNFILTRMYEDGMSREDALKLAQQKGYAEANPHADVAGLDSGRKISILASIAFGRYIPFDEVPICEGIQSVDLEDMRHADALGYTIKLLGVAERVGPRAKIIVAPHLVKKGSVLASVNDVYNAIGVVGNALGEIIFYGQGAGSKPTASAVVTDLLAVLISSPMEPRREPMKEGFIIPPSELQEEVITLPNNKSFRLYRNI